MTLHMRRPASRAASACKRVYPNAAIRKETTKAKPTGAPYPSLPKVLISSAAIPHSKPPMGQGTQKKAIMPEL